MCNADMKEKCLIFDQNHMLVISLVSFKQCNVRLSLKKKRKKKKVIETFCIISTEMWP